MSTEYDRLLLRIAKLEDAVFMGPYDHRVIIDTAWDGQVNVREYDTNGRPLSSGHHGKLTKTPTEVTDGELRWVDFGGLRSPLALILVDRSALDIVFDRLYKRDKLDKRDGDAV